MANPLPKSASKAAELKVAFFLAIRDVRRANIWTTILTIAVMILTFLNLVVVSGVLVGLIEGTIVAVKERYLGDVFISNLKNHSYIEKTPEIASFVRSLPEVEAVTVRYVQAGRIDGDYKSLPKAKQQKVIVTSSFSGIVPSEENRVSNLKSKIVEGEFLEDDDYDEVVLGAMLLSKYLDFESDAFPVLGQEIGVGSKIKIMVGESSREVVIKGIVRTKVDEIDRRVFFTSQQMRGLINRYDYSADEIAVKLKPNTDSNEVRDIIKGAGYDKYAKVQTALDAEPKFVQDLKNTFAILGNIISSIGLAVAAITVFIVIFINAITRRKYIGILKGIGISKRSIELSYVLQSVFYALCGMTIGAIIVFLILKPFFISHPISFPFGDGILVAEPLGTFIRGMILLVATIIAGLIPAKIVIKQNTLDAILGR